MHVQFLEPVFFRTSFSLPCDHPIFSLQRTVQSPISSICRHLIKPVLQKIRLLQVAWIATSDWLKLRGSHKYSQQWPTCCKTGLPWASKSCNMYRFPAKWRTILYFLDQVFATCNDSMNTVEPPVSDHPKWKDWVVAYRRWSLTGGGHLQESNHRGPLPRWGPGTSTLWKGISRLASTAPFLLSST